MRRAGIASLGPWDSSPSGPKDGRSESGIANSPNLDDSTMIQEPWSFGYKVPAKTGICVKLSTFHGI